MEVTQYHVDEQTSLFKLKQRSLAELNRLVLRFTDILPLATVPANRRDTEALIVACYLELGER